MGKAKAKRAIGKAYPFFSKTALMGAASSSTAFQGPVVSLGFRQSIC